MQRSAAGAGATRVDTELDDFPSMTLRARSSLAAR